MGKGENPMGELKDFILSLAGDAGRLLKDRFHVKHTVDYKGAIDIVTEADRLSEELIIKRIAQSYPQHDILAEESPATTKDSGYRWIIDPLDGTTNYAHGYPVFCVSIALEINGVVEWGVVYNPMLEEMFFAERGHGAILNGVKISVSLEQELSKSLLATGFPYDIRVSSDNNLHFFSRMAKQAQAIRRAGSAALDLAYLAAGRFDGFWELKLKPWDTAAGWLMILEAGGQVTDLLGNPYHLLSPHVLASNGKIHPQMMEVLHH
jgi:myo-inositol-1(or 4)-monophosphatase